MQRAHAWQALDRDLVIELARFGKRTLGADFDEEASGVMDFTEDDPARQDDDGGHRADAAGLHRAVERRARSAKETPAGKKPWVYRFEMNDPLPSYLVTLVVGDFDVVEDRRRRSAGAPSVPVHLLRPARARSDDARRAFGETPRMIELFGSSRACRSRGAATRRSS